MPFWGMGFLFFPRQLESLPMHSPHRAIFCPLQALWDMSPVFSGMHCCFYLQTLETKACMMATVQVSTETGPSELHGTSLFQSGFVWLESCILQQMTLISGLSQPRVGTDNLLCNQDDLRAPSHLFQPGTLGYLYVGRVTMFPAFSFASSDTQYHQVSRVKQAFGDWFPVIKLTTGWWINLPHNVIVRIKWESGHKA